MILKCGVSIKLLIGWVGELLVDKGVFMVDEVEYSGVLDVIMICVCFVLMMNDMYECWEKSWYW